METISTGAIRAHYDRLSLFYRRFWGEHIHHGFWRDGESPREAQLNLVTELAGRACIQRGANVLDVGCGLGASAIWLALELDCSVMGITISPVQKWLAEKRARSLGLNHRVWFRVMDANRLEFPAAEFNAVWVIESSEHLFDKRRFIADCARVLRPQGVFALCSWLRAEDNDCNRLAQICRGMLCPSLATFDEYQCWMQESQLDVITAEEITNQVTKTWQHCEEILKQPLVRACLPLLSRQSRRFVAQFSAMSRAYNTGTLRYGMFAARKL